jgi:hypothetical protein
MLTPPLALATLACDHVPVTEDEKHVSVVLRGPESLAELAQDKELKICAENDGHEGEGEGGEGRKPTVRWYGGVGAMGHFTEGMILCSRQASYLSLRSVVGLSWLDSSGRYALLISRSWLFVSVYQFL